MQTRTEKTTLRSILNKIFRQPKRIDITTVTKNITTVRECYKNKQIIFVIGNINPIFMRRL